ncbi:uncharacterized protein SPAPADRAFT_59671 [Spathaspora passalidarum NRRL Y-27907]|uniref:CCHC-type domain-containing protein n=1 Tax=Spathaspora passalidarum (strain NRRL Y-27907 / 11-Y1) TaxID=619300 RepID=G3AHS8_SPAPN|nr:uncharacterized protein SPAPADRAFT_59671 [Spathaspora passalidarum NRRL Y-27907]EGW34242.1 hypothetical protein SPAPADRAFT_59671 [Spathaspora passalidarum NRRL Y-27907]
MSIVELSATVDKLAKIINQKNKQLEDLKQGYDQKLHIINEYIRTLEGSIEGDSSKESIPNEEFIKKISSKVECPNCKHVIWDNMQSGEYVLVPKHQLKYLIRDTPQAQTQAHEPITPTTSTSNDTSYRPPKPKNRSKINCSFCGEPGHTRAKCYKRLTTPKEETGNP